MINKGILNQGAVAMSQIDQQPSDDQLILAIARDRCDTAFSELYQRYKGPAYNLAYYLTHDKDLAQEALQDAMFGIWFSAKTYSPGNAKGWILATVTRKCFAILRTRQRKKRLTDQIKARGSSYNQKPPIQNIEDKELNHAVREAIDELKASDRHLVALYFGASLTQREISHELKIPQRTVSDRIKILLKKVKSTLVRQGLEANLATITVGAISMALRGSQEVPPEFFQNIQKHISQANQKSIALNRSMQEPQRGRALRIVAPLAIAIFAGSWVYLNSRIPEKAQLKGMPKITHKETVIIINKFEDDFDDLKMKTFWIKPLTPNQIKSGVGQNNSQIILEAGGNEKVPFKGKRKVELISHFIDLKQHPFSYSLISGEPTGSGSFTIGLTLTNERGQIISHQYYRGTTQPDGRYLISRHATIFGVKKKLANPVFISKNVPASNFTCASKRNNPIVYTDTQAKKKNLVSYGNQETYFTAPIRSMSKIQFKFSIQAEPGSWIRWPINKFSFIVVPNRKPKALTESTKLHSLANR